MTTAKSFGAFLISREGISLMRDAGYAAIGAGMMTAGVVGLRDFATSDGVLATLVQASPLIATAAGGIWVLVTRA